jgi:hypothetical protein
MLGLYFSRGKRIPIIVPVRDDRIGLLDGDLGVVFLQILEADLQMELTSAGNDVLARLLNEDLHHGVGLRQTLQA